MSPETMAMVQAVVRSDAFRAGFEEARAGRPFAYPDGIVTLPFNRLVWAQCNYEDGRLLAAVSPVLSEAAFVAMIERGDVR